MRWRALRSRQNLMRVPASAKTMKNFFRLPLVALVFSLAISLGVFAETPFSGLIPLPQKVYEIGNSSSETRAFSLSSGTRIFYETANAGARDAAEFCAKTLGLRASELVPGTNAGKNAIIFRVPENVSADFPAVPESSPEAYALRVSADAGVEISARDFAGFFYGVQTFLRLLPAEQKLPFLESICISVPECEISDAPRFRWRGFMLDSVRHFQSPEWIKKLVDLLATHKINTLHWHLTDDQGWRIEIKKYPRLTERAAWRNEIGFGLSRADSTHFDSAGRYGGFYSQEQIREVVRYASARNVAIVPEIELPGHAVAALSVYPKLGCAGGPYEVMTVGGVSDEVFCAGNEAVFEFLENVLSEVVELFPGKFVHIGGDECPKTRWKTCPKCQLRMRVNNLKNERELQSWFIRRIEKFLFKKGKRLIGWDEILEGGLPERASVMSWRGFSGGIAAANAGHDVVMTPTQFCYFDYSQARSGEPRGIGGFVPLDRVYRFDPTAGIPVGKISHVLGAQANLWTEYIANELRAEYMIAPRIAALAEVLWTPRERLDYADFSARLLNQYERYATAGINFRKPDGIVIKETPAGVVFDPDLAGAKIFYTLDGSEPTAKSPATAPGVPVKIPSGGEPAVVNARVFFRGELGRVNAKTVRVPAAEVASTMGTVEDHFPSRCVDGTLATVYWADRCPRAGDSVTAIFAQPQRAREIRAITGKNDNGGGGDRLVSGILEISFDGHTWEKIADFSGGIAQGKIPGSREFRGVRIRATRSQNEWLVVREIELRK